MGLTSLNYCKDFDELTSFVKILWEISDNPQECPELYNSVKTSISHKLQSLSATLSQLCAVANASQIQVSNEKGELQNVNGLPVVQELLFTSFYKLFLQVALNQSENLALSRDICKDLFGRSKNQSNDEAPPIPSLTEKEVSLISMAEQILDQFHAQAVDRAQQSKTESSKDEDNNV